MKKLRALLISLVILVSTSSYSGDLIDDCLKTPGVKTILELKYKWIYPA